MAYRRRQGITRASTFKEEIIHRSPDEPNSSSSPLQPSKTFTASSSLAAQAIRASALSNERNNRSKDFEAYDDPSAKAGFWGVLARKAKAILEEEDSECPHDEVSGGIRSSQPFDNSGGLAQSSDSRMEHPAIRKSLDKITTSLNHIGDTFEKAFEEGRTIVENKTADIKQQIQRRGDRMEGQNQTYGYKQPRNPDTQLKASRDVAMATAAKAKLLLRELKTVKADLAFAKERCSQLEEENKRLRETRDQKGAHRADDDLIRLQLETLLAEKGRLANENSVYARENRFLREIVEYHQLTMQDVVYLSDEEVTEVYPLGSIPEVDRVLSSGAPSPPSEDLLSITPPVTKEVLAAHIKAQVNKDASRNEVMPTSDISPSLAEENKPASVAQENKTASVAQGSKPPSVAQETKTASVAEDTKRPPASSA